MMLIIIPGMKAIDGLSQYAEGIGATAEGMNSATKGLGIELGTALISGGYTQILDSLKQLQAGHEQLCSN